MKAKNFHIGQTIKDVVKSKHLGDSAFGKMIGKTRQNVYDLYKRDTIDVNFLFTISQALSYNFFKTYTDELGFDTPKDEIDEIKAVLQIELKQDKKDQVMKLVFGENNLEILNR